MAARECPICYLPFDKSSHFISTCVPCGHCACQQCLSSLKNSQCPFCRTKFTQIIKIFVDSAEEETKPLRCGNCPNRADMFCPQCISNFCKKCYAEIHAHNVFKCHSPPSKPIPNIGVSAPQREKSSLVFPARTTSNELMVQLETLRQENNALKLKLERPPLLSMAHSFFFVPFPSQPPHVPRLPPRPPCGTDELLLRSFGISQQHAAEIVSAFHISQLLTRYDTMTAEKSNQCFHALADNKGSTLTLLFRSNRYVGGVAYSSWNTHGSIEDKNAAVFFFNPSLSISRVQHEHERGALFGGNPYGPNFGNADLRVVFDPLSVESFFNVPYYESLDHLRTTFGLTERNNIRAKGALDRGDFCVEYSSEARKHIPQLITRRMIVLSFTVKLPQLECLRGHRLDSMLSTNWRGRPGVPSRGVFCSKCRKSIPTSQPLSMFSCPRCPFTLCLSCALEKSKRRN